LLLRTRDLLRTWGRIARARRRRASVAVAGVLLGLLLVVQGAFGPGAPVAYAGWGLAGALTADDVFGGSLPSAADLAAGCEAVTGGTCTFALGIGALLVGAGWVFANRAQVYSAIQTVWDNMTQSQAQELRQNMQANSDTIVNPSSELTYGASYDVSNVSTLGGYTEEALTGTSGGDQMYTDKYLVSSLPAGQQVQVMQWDWTVGSAGFAPGDPVAALEYPSSGGGTNNYYWLGTPDLANATVSANVPAKEILTLTDLTNSQTQSWSFAAGSPSDNIADTAVTSSPGDQIEVDMYLDNTGTSAVNYALYTGSAIVFNMVWYSGGFQWATLPSIADNGGSGSLTVQGYSVPGTLTPNVSEPATVSVPNTIDQLINANPGTSVTTLGGGTATIGSNAGTGQAGLLGGILGGIEAIPQDVANEFVPTVADSAALTASLSNVESQLGQLQPFAGFTAFFNSAQGYFNNAGSTCPDPSWSFTLPGFSTWSYNVSLCDQLNVMATVREISSWVIYGAMLIFLFEEVRRWFQYGHM